MALRKRALQNTENLSHQTRALPPLQVHDAVQVQNQVGNKPSRWDITGVVVEVKSHDQYLVKVHGSGRMTLRNRKFLKKILPYCPSPRMNPLPLDIPLPKDDAGETSSDMSHTSSTPDDNVSEPTNHSDDPTRAPSDEQQGDVQPKHVQQQQPAVEEPTTSTGPRRSTRTTAEPQRLNIQSWGGQSYDGIAGQVGQVPAGQIHHGGPPQGYSGVSWPHLF